MCETCAVVLVLVKTTVTSVMQKMKWIREKGRCPVMLLGSDKRVRYKYGGHLYVQAVQRLVLRLQLRFFDFKIKSPIALS